MTAVRVVGAGRAGSSLARALGRAGWEVLPPLGRGDDLSGAATGADLVVIATPDAAVAGVAAAVEPVESTVVAHMAGSLGLDVVAPHPRRASLHPLVPLPDPETGAALLASGAWFAVAGDPLAGEAVAALGGRAVVVPDEHRALYHAAACIASNHLVALLGQVERVAGGAGLPLGAYLDLVRATVDNVAALGPAAALTGPVARGDRATVERHLAALAPTERAAYRAMAEEAARLATSPSPFGRGIWGCGPRSRGQIELPVLDTLEGLRKALDAERAAGRTVGLVPTMGALHEGHTSLVRRAAAECDVVAVTIFVNPLQFGSNEDLSAYPRDPEGDRRKAAAAGADLLFAPSAAEMGSATTLATVHVAGLGDGLEGASRPGHFDGVATVVAKLFAVAAACRAYFGEKDWQQLAVVRRMAADLSFPVEVVPCPTVRAPDGLALSSRNAYLSPAERAAAPVLHRALQEGRALIERGGERDPGAVRRRMAAVVAAEPLATPDYAEVVAADTLAPVSPLAGELRLMVAARFGPARLIDNMGATA